MNEGEKCRYKKDMKTKICYRNVSFEAFKQSFRHSYQYSRHRQAFTRHSQSSHIVNTSFKCILLMLWSLLLQMKQTLREDWRS